MFDLPGITSQILCFMWFFHRVTCFLLLKQCQFRCFSCELFTVSGSTRAVCWHRGVFCCQATLDVVMNLQFHYIEKLWQSFWSPKAPPSDGPTALPSRYSPAFPAPFLGDMFLFKMHKVFLGFLSALENLEVFSALQSRDKERRKCLIL